MGPVAMILCEHIARRFSALVAHPTWMCGPGAGLVSAAPTASVSTNSTQHPAGSRASTPRSAVSLARQHARRGVSRSPSPPGARLTCKKARRRTWGPGLLRQAGSCPAASTPRAWGRRAAHA